MAFTYTEEKGVIGNKRYVKGVYTSAGGSTGGDIVTGLSVVENVFLQPKGSATVANQPAVNETLPLSNATGAVTIVTTANEVGSYLAIGL